MLDNIILVNKFGVPYHEYKLIFFNGEEKIIDIGYEEDWGNIQTCCPDDCDDWVHSIGFGNDYDGHIKIINVIDIYTNEEINPLKFYKMIGKYTRNYSS